MAWKYVHTSRARDRTGACQIVIEFSDHHTSRSARDVKDKRRTSVHRSENSQDHCHKPVCSRSGSSVCFAKFHLYYMFCGPVSEGKNTIISLCWTSVERDRAARVWHKSKQTNHTVARARMRSHTYTHIEVVQRICIYNVVVYPIQNCLFISCEDWRYFSSAFLVVLLISFCSAFHLFCMVRAFAISHALVLSISPLVRPAHCRPATMPGTVISAAT